jgi:trimethylamine--corrinoid protein Co-methyltransferase
MKRNLQAGRLAGTGLSLNILSDDELQQIHYGTLEVLNDTGVFVEDDAALDRFEQGGARVDHDARIVKIPPHVVEDAIRSAPPKVVLYGRDPKHDIVLEGSRIHFTNFSEGVMVNDPYTGENRRP